MKNNKKASIFWRKLPAWLRRVAMPVIIYAIVAAVVLGVSADTWEKEPVSTDGVIGSGWVGINAGETVSQQFSAGGDVLNTVSLFPLGVAAGSIHIDITDDSGSIFAQDIAPENIPIGGELVISPYVSLSGSPRISITPSAEGFALCFGTNISAGKIEVEDTSGSPYELAGVPQTGKLVLKTTGIRHRDVMTTALIVAVALGAILAALLIVTEIKRKKGKISFIAVLEDVAKHYSFLLRQLVRRDFRVKYKGSMLGVLWSVLNPVLTTGVYYLVFSTLFKNNVENFPVYLISGTIVFSYFSDATNQCLTSIVGNAPLLTKVYVPKYILPLSKVLSSVINLAISLIPLIVIMLATGCPITKALWLLPVFLVFLCLFVYGIGMLLASAHVFFRDMQFLWGIVVMLLNFLTPIFYPVSIISEEMMPIYMLNPMTQLVSFIRSICISGCAPAPEQFVTCGLIAIVTVCVGFVVFRRSQNSFMTHL